MTMLLLVLAGTLVFPFARGLVYGHGKDSPPRPKPDTQS